MAKAARKLEEVTSGDDATTMVKGAELPEDFSFEIETNIPVPEATGPSRTGANQHAYLAQFTEMGHNDTLFIPLGYFVKRGYPADTPLKKLREKVLTGFSGWKKKGGEALAHWRLTAVVREVGDDPSKPNLAGIRVWKVDTTR